MKINKPKFFENTKFLPRIKGMKNKLLCNIKNSDLSDVEKKKLIKIYWGNYEKK